MPNQPLPTPTPPPTAVPHKAPPVAPATPVVAQPVPSSTPPTGLPKPNTPPATPSMPVAATSPVVSAAPGLPKPSAPATPPALSAAPTPSVASPGGSNPIPKPAAPMAPLTAPIPGKPGTAPSTIPQMPPRPPGMAGLPPAAPPAGTPPGVTPPGGAPPAPPAGTPAAASTPAGKAAPQFASIKKTPLRFLPFVLGALVIVGVIGFILSRFLGGGSATPITSTPTTPNQPAASVAPNTNTSQAGRTSVPSTQTTLTYWGLWEPNEVLATVFQDFEAANPGVKVNYVKQSHKDFRDRLQNGIASTNGPDVFRYHASWVPMLANELAPMPSSVMSATEYQQTFYPVTTKQLQVNGQIVGIPLMYDGLALYYNQEIFKTAGVQPPTTWAELRTLASQLTVRSSAGKIERGGLAIGTTSNVEHFSDILGLLMLQNGADLTKPTSSEARDALTFYTNFAKTDKVWDSTLPASTVAFARGEVAMMFAPSWRAHEVKALNPSLQFGITSLPKLGSSKTSWASYWAEGVNNKSKNKDVAWKLLEYMSSKDVMKKMYSEQSKVRAFGEPYSRVDLASELASDPLVSPYLKDAPNADSWYLNSATHDNGINDQIIKYYEDAINAVVAGKAPDEALTTVDQGTSQVLRQYGVTGTTAR